MKILLTCNVRKEKELDENIEWDEPSTVSGICEGIRSLGHQVEILDCSKTGFKDHIVAYKPDLVFNIAEGKEGENRESEVPLVLDELGIPYTGSGPETLRLCLNKEKTKKRLDKCGIPTPAYLVADKPLQTLPPLLTFPVIVKPLWEGSSKGIKNDSLVFNEEQLYKQTKRVIEELSQSAIIEHFLNGREFTVGVIGNGDDLEILPVVEINIPCLPNGANPLYSFEAKWIWDVPENPLDIFKCPAQLSTSLENRVNELVRDTFKALGCLDWARIDLRMDDSDNVYVLEVNPLPGIIPDPDANSCFPKAARARGYSYGRLLHRVIETAKKRYHHVFAI